MSDIKNNLLTLKKDISDTVTLVAVSKTKPTEDILEAYSAGQRVFGENKIQELAEKWEVLPKDINWHMIGHVQTNKVKYMAAFVDLIHAVDSLKLLKEINKQAKKHKRVINCLLQVKIADEESKFGLSQDEIVSLLNSKEISSLEHVNIQGYMGMATFTNDTTQIQNEFEALATFFEHSKLNHPNLNTLSIGMSGDYKIAMKCGSTMVRIGSSIFGSRNYA